LVITSNVNEIGKYEHQHPHANNYQLRFGLTSSPLGEHTLTVSVRSCCLALCSYLYTTSCIL